MKLYILSAIDSDYNDAILGVFTDIEKAETSSEYARFNSDWNKTWIHEVKANEYTEILL